MSKIAEGGTAVADLVTACCPLCRAERSRFERTVDGYAVDRCLKCGFVFMNPRMTDAALDRLYSDRDEEELIAYYERMHTPTILRIFDDKLDRIEKWLPGKGRLLDFACGSGHFFERAGQRGWDAHGVELGRWAVESTRRRGVPNLHNARLQDLHFPDGHFDVVNASQVFEHLTDPLTELAELKRVLRPGGLLTIDVPNYRTLPILLNVDDFMLNAPPQHVGFYTPGTFRKLLRDGGFTIERVFTSSGLKWENLLGMRIRSEIADAHNKPASDAPRPAVKSGVGSKVKSACKTAVKATVLTPFFYNWWKLGILLAAVARKPG